VGLADRTSPSGSIYDLGYRHYDGLRLGRRHATTALLRHTFRSCYGIGRGGRAKIAPITLGGLAIIPAIIAVGVIGLASQAAGGEAFAEASPIRPDTYYAFVGTIVTLFVAAQAPELVGRDQRHGVLALYFSRALRRSDYALAKAGGLFAALLVLLLIPQAVLFFGQILSSRDLAGAFVDHAADLPPIIAQGALIAALSGSLGLAIAAFTPRRAYATIAIIAAFVIPAIVAGVAGEYVSRDASRWLLLTSVGDILDGTNAFLFGGPPTNDAISLSRIGGEVFLGAALAGTAASVAALIRRYQGIDA
jgi:ABC-2 type transport system permease protein